MNISEIKKFVADKKIEREVLSKQLNNCQINIKNLESNIQDFIQARNIVSEAARITQKQFKVFVEELTTLAIQSIFPDRDYKFLVNFELKNNRSQIDLLVQQGNKDPYSPSEEQGGGMLDVISFALRVILWSLEKPKSRATLIFDEPFRFCGALTVTAANFMKEVSRKLGIQMIMVTHDEVLAEIADKSWKVYRGLEGSTIIENSDLEIVYTPKISKRRKIK